MTIVEKLIQNEWHIRILEMLLVLVAAFAIYKLISKLLIRQEAKDGKKNHLAPRRKTYYRLAGSAVRYAIMVVAGLLILSIAGVNISSLVAGLGIVSIIVGLALQDWLKDIIRGASIISDSYFHVGDVIRYREKEGEVLAIGLKTTRIRLVETNNILSVANRNLEEIEVVSWILRERIPMPYDVPVYQAEKVIQDMVARVEKNEYVENCRYLGVQALSASSIDYFLEIRANPLHHRQVRRDMYRSVLLAMEKYGIPVPYQQLDVHTVSDAERSERYAEIFAQSGFREYAEKSSRSSSDSIFRTEKYRVRFTGSNQKEILDGAEYFVTRMGCSKKEMLRIRLLIEEMMELTKTVTEQSMITVIINVRERICVVRAEMSGAPEGEQKGKLERLSSIGNHPASGESAGLVARMRGVVASLLTTGSRQETHVWSLKEYIDSVMENDRLGDREQERAREEIEHSIIAKLADDVKVSFSADSVMAEATRSIRS